MRPFAAFILLLFLSTGLGAQTVDELISAGDLAASEDRHQEAIDFYQQAVAIDQAMRVPLAAKLGRQLLWSGSTNAAIDLLELYLKEHPEACDVRLDLALARSWTSSLAAALEEYETIEAGCPELSTVVALRKGLIQRWLDQPSAATRLYESVLEEGDPSQQDEARVGLAYVSLMLDRNREARERFRQLYEPGVRSPSLYEGLAISEYRLGDRLTALDLLAEARREEIWSESLQRLETQLDSIDAWYVSSELSGFEDRDGTERRAFEITGGKMVHEVGLGIFTGVSRLEDDSIAIDDEWVGLAAGSRLDEALAVSGRLAAHEFDTGFEPLVGELNLTWLPDDERRFDLAVARLIISDNIAAVTNELSGDYLSAGVDWKVRPRDVIAVGIDRTDWSEGNVRTRLHLDWRHRFEGVPRLTVSFPTLYQHYDEPFEFSLFSPREYVETGPALNVYRRFARSCEASLYLRAGIQRETGRDAEFLGMARARLEREVLEHWGVRATVSWSNSSVASPGGFERFSATLEATYRF